MAVLTRRNVIRFGALTAAGTAARCGREHVEPLQCETVVVKFEPQEARREITLPCAMALHGYVNISEQGQLKRMLLMREGEEEIFTTNDGQTVKLKLHTINKGYTYSAKSLTVSLEVAGDGTRIWTGVLEEGIPKEVTGITLMGGPNIDQAAEAKSHVALAVFDEAGNVVGRHLGAPGKTLTIEGMKVGIHGAIASNTFAEKGALLILPSENGEGSIKTNGDTTVSYLPVESRIAVGTYQLLVEDITHPIALEKDDGTPLCDAVPRAIVEVKDIQDVPEVPQEAERAVYKLSKNGGILVIQGINEAAEITIQEVAIGYTFAAKWARISLDIIDKDTQQRTNHTEQVLNLGESIEIVLDGTKILNANILDLVIPGYLI